MPTFDHPEHLAIGQHALTVRRSWSGSIHHQAEVVITRQSKTSIWAAYVGHPESENRYVRKEFGGHFGPVKVEYHQTPKYLSYDERLEPLDEES